MRCRQPRFVSALGTTALMLLVPLTAHAAIGTINRTLHVSGPVVLHVHDNSGSVHVSPGAAGEVHIVGHLHASGIAYGQPAADRIQRVLDHPPIEQSGGAVTIRSHLDGTTNVAIDYDITVPARSQLEVATGSGDLRLEGLGGSLKAFTGAGSIEARGFTGHVWLRCGSGWIRAELQGSNDVMARTGDGAIRVRGVNGPLLVEAGSGDVHIAGRPAGDWLVHTGYGQVTLVLGNASFALDASTGSGSITSERAVTSQGILNRHRVAGKVNGGGPTVRVETGAGDIRIR
jgi:hypothetical protein